MFTRSLMVVSLVLALAACATAPSERDVQRSQAYAAAAGEPVRSFRYFNPLYSWEPVGDSQLVVYTKPQEAYLLDTAGPCPDLSYAPAIALTSNMSTVYVNFDKIIAGRSIPCTISQIRPVDVGRLKAIQHEQRKVETQERQADGAK